MIIRIAELPMMLAMPLLWKGEKNVLWQQTTAAAARHNTTARRGRGRSRRIYDEDRTNDRARAI
jgi:hypothetical protein